MFFSLHSWARIFFYFYFLSKESLFQGLVKVDQRFIHSGEAVWYFESDVLVCYIMGKNKNMQSFFIFPSAGRIWRCGSSSGLVSCPFCPLLTYGTSSKLQRKRMPIEGDGKDFGQKIMVIFLIYRKACLIRDSGPTYCPQKLWQTSTILITPWGYCVFADNRWLFNCK